MALHGKSILGVATSGSSGPRFKAVDPTTGRELEPAFHEATSAEVQRAGELAAAARQGLAASAPEARAALLRAIGEGALSLGDELLERVAAETGLPAQRLVAERGRMVGQLGVFADLIEEGSWVDARIDRARPERKPLPRPDVRRMLVPLGPVAVFGASNFPLAFSAAGGDVASALAAGCPVVLKAHPAHPGTCELLGTVAAAAAREAGLPEGTFTMVQGEAERVGRELVEHPEIRVVGFTGSLRGGRALFDLAARRAEPIPVFAEMGSANPVFVLPGALRERGAAIAEALAGSVTLGAGQFCTNPGLTVVEASAEGDGFLRRLGGLLGRAPAGTVVHRGIREGYEAALQEVLALGSVRLEARAEGAGSHPSTGALAALLSTDAAAFAATPRLGEEVYGPATLAVRCAGADDLVRVARALRGHLTATVHGTERDLEEHAELLAVLREKVGRLIVNGVPTGVEVCPAMQHGGPYPATTDARFTSVGSAAIARFARPLCFQDVPQGHLPAELRDENPRGIWRLVDGAWTRDPL